MHSTEKVQIYFRENNKSALKIPKEKWKLAIQKKVYALLKKRAKKPACCIKERKKFYLKLHLIWFHMKTKTEVKFRVCQSDIVQND